MTARANLGFGAALCGLLAGGCLTWEPRRAADAGRPDADAGDMSTPLADAGANPLDANDGLLIDDAAAPSDARVDATVVLDAGSADGGLTAADGGSDAGEGAVPRAGLLLWLRADRGVTVADNGRVLAWQDQSPSSAETGQLTDDFRPLLISGPGGLPGVVFDGVDDFLSVPAGFADFTAGVTIVAVVAILRENDHMPVFEASNGREIEDVHMGRFDGGLLLEVDTQYANPGPVEGDAVQLLASVLTPELDATLRRNGGVLGFAQFPQLPPNVRRSEVFVGRSLYDGVGTFAGVLEELLVFGRALSNTELLAVEQELAGRWQCCSL